MNLKSEETIFQHWCVELAQFEFIMIHKKGSENVNADALSRANHLDEEYQEANEMGEMKITFASELEGNRKSEVEVCWISACYSQPK